MFGHQDGGAKAYVNVGVETGVRAASPHKLIVMLFDGTLEALITARQSMKVGDISRKGRAISQAISIIENGLRASLNKDVGGEIAGNLDALYEYISHRLLTANMQNDLDMLDEATRLIKELRGAWEQIGERETILETQPEPQRVRDPLAPSVSRSVKA